MFKDMFEDTTVGFGIFYTVLCLIVITLIFTGII